MYFVLASFQKWEMIGRWLLGGRGGGGGGKKFEYDERWNFCFTLRPRSK